jgi:hypothetical protein
MLAMNTRFLRFPIGILLLRSFSTSITFVSAGPIPFLPTPTLAVRAFPARYECHSKTAFYSDDAGHFQECAPGTVCRKVASGSPCVWPDAGGNTAPGGSSSQGVEGSMTTQQPGASPTESPAPGETAATTTAPLLDDAFPLPSDDGTEQTTASTPMTTPLESGSTPTDSVAPGATPSAGDAIPSGTPSTGDSTTPEDDETDELCPVDETDETEETDEDDDEDEDEECEEDDEIGDVPASEPPAGQNTEQIPTPTDSGPGAGETATTPPIDDPAGEEEEDEECEEDDEEGEEPLVEQPFEVPEGTPPDATTSAPGAATSSIDPEQTITTAPAAPSPTDTTHEHGADEECEDDHAPLPSDGTPAPSGTVTDTSPTPTTDVTQETPGTLPGGEEECEEGEMTETPDSDTTHQGSGDDLDPSPSLNDPFPLPTEEASAAPSPSTVPNA